jgi:hypothetical protein
MLLLCGINEIMLLFVASEKFICVKCLGFVGFNKISQHWDNVGMRGFGLEIGLHPG